MAPTAPGFQPPPSSHLPKKKGIKKKSKCILTWRHFGVLSLLSNGEQRAVKCDTKVTPALSECQGSNSGALLKFAGKNSQNMAAGGFCVSDCSSPHRPSCCHYRPVPPLRSTRINSVLNMGGVHIYASELGVHTAKQQFNRNFIAKI